MIRSTEEERQAIERLRGKTCQCGRDLYVVLGLLERVFAAEQPKPRGGDSGWSYHDDFDCGRGGVGG